jgi:Flp pilus assembly pilin Flp
MGQGMNIFDGRRRHRPDRHRGAVAVEYALGVALLLVVSVGAIDVLQDSAQSNLTTHGATAGAPDLPDAGIPVTTSTTSPGPTTPPTSPPPSSVTADAAFSATSLGVSSSGNRWSPSVDVTATDSTDGTVLTGVSITVQWTELPSGQQTTQTFTVPSTGVASFQLNDLHTNVGTGQFVDSVMVTITAITGTNPVITYTPGPSNTITLDGPNT